jgi:hypothetical protein
MPPAGPTPGPPAPEEDNVLPPDARPYGYTLADLAQQLALFTVSGNNLANYPNTPFQILYAAPPFATVPVGNGTVFSGGNTFTVARGTPFYVPLFNADDSPPFVPPYPKSAQQASNYFFNPSLLGGQDFYVFVDGVPTELGPDYVAGPVKTPVLPDGGGTHIITLGAFIKPLPPGDHTVRISGHSGSMAVLNVFGFGNAFGDFLFTYLIHVNH